MKNFTYARLIFLFFASSVFFSCATTSSITLEQDESILQNQEPEQEKPATVTFYGRGVKLEMEDLFLVNCEPTEDESASKKNAVKFGGNSVAKINVQIPQGEYEILFSQKAYSTKGSHFEVFIDEQKYETYPSEPPLGTWELTIRKPVVFKTEEPRTISITVKGMEEKMGRDFFLDYFQIVKISE